MYIAERSNARIIHSPSDCYIRSICTYAVFLAWLSYKLL